MAASALRFARSRSKENQLRLLSVILLSCGCVSLVDGPPWPPAQTYVDTAAPCGQSNEPARCLHIRQTWEIDYQEAIAGGHRAQKHVALCLSTGCDGAIQPDKVLGCAWRIVIAETAHAEPGSTDAGNVDRFCGANYINERERMAAASQAKTMRPLIGR